MSLERVNPDGHLVGGRRFARARHFEEGGIRSAAVILRTLKYAGIGSPVCAAAINAWRLGNALGEDVYIRNNAAEIIKKLKGSIEELKKELIKTARSSMRRQKIEEMIEHLSEMLDNVRRTRKVPVRTIETTSLAVAGWGAGAAGAYFGAAIGRVFGGPVGATIGAIAGGIGATMLGGHAAEYVTDKALETIVEL